MRDVVPGVGSSVKSADRLMTVLEHLASVGEATFASIANDLGYPNSSTHQLLRTMASRGFIEFSSTSRTYRLGAKVWKVGRAYRDQGELVRHAQPLMDELAKSLGETIQLARLDGTENIYLAISESPQPMKLVSAVHSRLPAHTTGLGKVLLSGLDDAELRRRYQGVELERMTARTITDVEELISAIGQIRVQGFGEDREEYVVGCRCVAMPIHDAGGTVVAALSVSVPTPRYNSDLAARMHAELRSMVSDIEVMLSPEG